MHRHESVQEVGGVRRKGDNPGDLSGAYEWNIPKAKNIVFVKPDYVFHLAAHFANQ